MTPVKYEYDIHQVITILMIVENEQINGTEETATAEQAVESSSSAMLTWIVWIQYIP